MKPLLPLAAFAALVTLLAAETSTPVNPAPAAKLTSNVYVWEKLANTPTSNGSRRAVFDGPTTSLDKLHCHITTLNPGEKSGEPRLHLQEEVIIVKEGTLEAVSDGVARTATAGSVIYFAAHSTTYMRNTGTTPATYTVIYYYTASTPKS